MRIVVTGATSMIGIALIRAAIRDCSEVLAIVREKSFHIERLPQSELISVIYSDLNALYEVDRIGDDWDVFYHLAWMGTSKEDRDCPGIQEVNIAATLNAVELAKKLGCKIFIGAGSQAEYGCVEGTITENTPVNPVTAYGIAKLSAGLLSRNLCHQLKIKYIWGRIFSVYGENDKEETMIKYALDCFKNEKIAYFSSGMQKWNYLYEEDAGNMIYILGKKQVDEGVYCIGGCESKKLKEYIEEIRKCFVGNTFCQYAAELSNGNDISIDVDISKFISATGYTPNITFSDGIKRMISA